MVALSQDPGHLNPAITTSGAVHPAAELLYNGLLSLDEAGRASPELAADLPQIEENGAVYRFTLRDGVRWHDGRPFTSADVKFTFEQLLLKLHARSAASIGRAIEAIETPDERTVVFRFKQPYAPFLQQLDVTEAPIVARHIYEGTDPNTNPANTKPVGTGPFRFVSYRAGSEIRYERNPNYFKEGLPYLDSVVMRVMPETSTQLLGLERGQIDWVPTVPGPDLSRLQDDADITTVETSWNPGGSNCIMTMSFNLQRAMFREKRLRQAVAHALDRDRFAEQILFGQGQVARAPISSEISWAHAADVDMPEFDRARAERLLDEAGWERRGEGARVAEGVTGVPDGTRLQFDFLLFPTFQKYGELVREQLGAVGIDVRLRPLEPTVFAPTVFEDRDFDTNVISYCNGTDPEIGVRRMYDSAQIGPVPFSNSSAYSNDRVDALFEEAARETSRSARSALYRQIQEAVVEDMPYVWLVETTATRAHSARCTGFKFYNGLFAESAFCRS